ncbi:L,D-transpeptidase family protein [Flavobacterium humi]|nr:L,D-transpeptidase family protein [Flavobacterium humi]
MKLILPVLFCFFLYIGCGNNTNTEIIAHKSTLHTPGQKTELFGWENPENRRLFIESIRNSEKEGLFPDDYSLKKLEKLEESYSTLSEKEIEGYYKQLSSSFIKYTSNLANGKLNPREIYPDWEIKKNKFKGDSILSTALAKNKIDSVIESCKPKHAIYAYLKKALAVVNALPDENFTPIATTDKFDFGDKGKNIVLIKKRLQYWDDLSKNDTLNEVYNEAMHDAVKKFQSRHGLEPDGVIGKGTIAALNFTKTQRKQQIIDNLERWRWFPRDLGINHIVVNIPDFYLHAVQNTDTIKTHRVVVGTEKRKTPILSSRIDNIVFNPTWTVPPTILKEDLIPGTQKSRNYITSRNITIYNRKGEEVSLGNWSFSNAENYRYVQSPGEDNALGFVKINFPNSHLVYLHDTNHRDYFVKNFRALSSGCVRVENPLNLAEYLLFSKKIYTPEKIDSILFLKKTKTVKIEEEFDVHILYFTAWYAKGQLQFRNDVYNYDPELYLRLSNQFRSNLVTSARVINK